MLFTSDQSFEVEFIIASKSTILIKKKVHSNCIKICLPKDGHRISLQIFTKLLCLTWSFS